MNFVAIVLCDYQWSVLADVAAAGSVGFLPGPADQLVCYHLLHRDLIRPLRGVSPKMYAVTARGSQALAGRPR